MNENEFEVGARKYKLSKIDPFKQFHIVRRLGPILGDIIPVAQKLKAMQSGGLEKTEEQKLTEISMMAQPIMAGFSKLTDEDANMVLLGLCSAVEVHQPQHNCWGKISDGKMLMFQDLGLAELLQVAARAFVFNLSGFFSSAPQTLQGGK